MIRRLLGAIQFLTILPIPGQTETPGRSALFFPLVGAFLGAFCGLTFEFFRKPFGAALAALLALSLAVALSGGLHEDGLADCADALRSGRTREKMLAILKDSRIGVYGAIALILCIAVRWQALAHVQVNAVPGLVSSFALSRSSMVVLGAITKPVGSGLASAFSQTLTPATSTLVAVQVVIAAGFCGWRGVPMLLLTAAIIAGARAYFIRRLGGVNGDCLGATCLIVETANLLVLAWHILYLIRHAEPEGSGTFLGQADPPLAPGALNGIASSLSALSRESCLRKPFVPCQRNRELCSLLERHRYFQICVRSTSGNGPARPGRK